MTEETTSSLGLKPVLVTSIPFLLYFFYNPLVFLFLSLIITLITTLIIIFCCKMCGWIHKRKGNSEVHQIKHQVLFCRTFVLVIESFLMLAPFAEQPKRGNSFLGLLDFLIHISVLTIVTELIIARFVAYQVKGYVLKKNRPVECLIVAAYVILLAIDFPSPNYVVVGCSTIIAYEAMMIQQVWGARLVMKNKKEVEMRE
uniref:Serpentine receptor class gamma n=1 Tax=Caenorhabditis tropicalis TaxID=1561998 RepID=A0A1I7THF8_9PELO